MENALPGIVGAMLVIALLLVRVMLNKAAQPSATRSQWVGLRTQYAMSSDSAWVRVHNEASRLWEPTFWVLSLSTVPAVLLSTFNSDAAMNVIYFIEGVTVAAVIVITLLAQNRAKKTAAE